MPNLVEVVGLFGLEAGKANRDFRDPANWKKNIFNNAFPVALAAWMGEQNINGVYLKLNTQAGLEKVEISTTELFGLPQSSASLYYGFESSHTGYVSFLANPIPRIDLVTFDKSSGVAVPLRALEIKLTALPDHSTADRNPELYGCEIVVRADSIVYAALSIAQDYIAERDKLLAFLAPACANITNWQLASEVQPHLADIVLALDQLMLNKLDQQRPLVLQPIWRTVGQKLVLAEQCFDLFVWSNYGFTRLFMQRDQSTRNIGRPARTAVWLAKMLYDFAQYGQFNSKQITSTITYGPKDDKAFAVSGRITQPLMSCSQLSNPRVPKAAVRQIILGGGQDYLQPERRLDAAILTTPGLFSS